MSLPVGCSSVGSHLELFHASVNASVYSRVGEIGAWARPPGASGLAHASWVLAALPSVVKVGTPEPAMVSHGPAAAMLESGAGAVQPATLTQQPMTELVGVLDVEKLMVGLARK